MSYLIGWCVGPWNCDGAKRQDALIALEITESGSVGLAAAPVRGNVRSSLIHHQREALLQQVIAACGLEASDGLRMTLVVDVPLGWPQPMVELLTTRRTADIPVDVDENPLLFRQTELRLLSLGHRPLSPIRDMIGGQSSKAIHFIRQAGLSQSTAGQWRVVSPATHSVYEVIETHTPACRRSPTFRAAFEQLKDAVNLERIIDGDAAARQDLESAASCALMANWFSVRRSELIAPDIEIPEREGWIWIPADAEPAARKKA